MTHHFDHTAMATRFDLWLCGEDADLLQSVAYQAWEEIDRLEMMMSRHDTRAELARINREAHERPVRIEIELFDVLEDCRYWHSFTNGYFDIAYRTSKTLINDITTQRYSLDRENRTISFAFEGVELDLGGYGKGYALDRVAGLLAQYNLENAFVQGGTSSALARGTKEDGNQWRIDIPHPQNPARVVDSKTLQDKGFSYSATYHPKTEKISDIIDPHTRRPISTSAACWMISPTALQAEVLTTALLAMGETKAGLFCTKKLDENFETGWVTG